VVVVATGQVTGGCYPRHRHGEFLRFLKKVAAAYPGQDPHVVGDCYSTRKHAKVSEWLSLAQTSLLQVLGVRRHR
jgi:hypothetical protein